MILWYKTFGAGIDDSSICFHSHVGRKSAKQEKLFEAFFEIVVELVAIPWFIQAWYYALLFCVGFLEVLDMNHS